MIWRIIYIICFVAALAFSACGHKNMDDNTSAVTESIEGWINDDTYQIVAGGIPIPNLILIDQRKESARLAAILNARCQIIAAFTGYKIKQEDLKNNNELDGISVHEELKAVVKAGIIKKTVWDYDANCEVVYEIKYPGLRKKVDDNVWK